MTSYRPARSPGRSLVRPLLLPLALAAVAITGCQRDTSAPPAPTAPVETVPVAHFDARLNLMNNNGLVRFDGTVDNAKTRDAIVAALTRAYGAERVSGHLDIDGGARPAPWGTALPQFLAAFTQAGAAVTFEGRRVELGGYASESDREALLARAELLFPGYAYTGLFQGVGNHAAGDAAEAVLAKVKPGTSGNALVQALNEAVTQTPIRFEPGSARVAPDSLALLSKAAQVIQASGGARLEVAGPSGDDPSLSQQRAEAIKVQLIINGVSPAAIETARTAASGDSAQFRLLQ